MATKVKTVCEKASLWCCKGTSDKVYVVVVVKGGDKYEVVARWGRRGGVMHEQTKWAGGARQSAVDVFDRLVASKKRRGYEVA
jgi:predicted DNA-binding WGR domain protein